MLKEQLRAGRLRHVAGEQLVERVRSAPASKRAEDVRTTSQLDTRSRPSGRVRGGRSRYLSHSCPGAKTGSVFLPGSSQVLPSTCRLGVRRRLSLRGSPCATRAGGGGPPETRTRDPLIKSGAKGATDANNNQKAPIRSVFGGGRLGALCTSLGTALGQFSDRNCASHSQETRGWYVSRHGSVPDASTSAPRAWCKGWPRATASRYDERCFIPDSSLGRTN
jgi:hypothetical protein